MVVREAGMLSSTYAPLHRHGKGVTMWVTSRTPIAPASRRAFVLDERILLGFAGSAASASLSHRSQLAEVVATLQCCHSATFAA
jgi:hypothetical protein